MAAGKTLTAASRRRAKKPTPDPIPTPVTPSLPRKRSAGGQRLARNGLYGYIWVTSGRAQVMLALLSIFIFLLDLAPLELQRRIVNDAISQKAFDRMAWLCGIYALVALVQGIAKLAWNVYRNSVGEAASQRLRLDTFAAALHWQRSHRRFASSRCRNACRRPNRRSAFLPECICRLESRA